MSFRGDDWKEAHEKIGLEINKMKNVISKTKCIRFLLFYKTKFITEDITTRPFGDLYSKSKCSPLN